VGYEVPVDRVKISYQNILDHSETKAASYGYWGMVFRPLKPELQQYYFGDGTDQSGVQISQVFSGSPADKAGVKAGDILLVEDKIYNVEMLYLANQPMIDSRPGSKVSLKILRNKQTQTVELIADERSYGRPDAYHTNRNFTVTDLRWIYRERNGVTVQGVIATFDNEEQKWMFSDMRKDCVIISVNGVPTADVKTFQTEWERAMTDKQPNIVLSVHQAPNDFVWNDGGVGNIQQVVVRK
jgi:serine protease Do